MDNYNTSYFYGSMKIINNKALSSVFTENTPLKIS